MRALTRGALGLLALLWGAAMGFAQNGAVHLEVTVTDPSGAYVRDLRPSQFVVSVDKTKLAVREARLKTDTSPKDIALLIDTSVIAGQVANPLNDVTMAFINDLGPDDQMAIVSFDSSADLIQDFTASKKLLEDAAHRIRYGNGAAVLDAIYATADGGYANSTARRTMVLLSAGIDTGSRTKLKDVLPLIQKRRVIFYGVSLGGRGFFGGGTSEIFDKLTVATGGRSFYPRKANDLAGIVNQIMGIAGKREYYDLTLEALPMDPAEAQQRLRVQVDRNFKEDKNLIVTGRFVKE